MTPNQGSQANRTGRVTVLQFTCGLVLGAWILAPQANAGEDWVTFTDETNTRIVADPSVGVNDQEEKDLVAGDVDKDGDDDLVVVRKEPFTNPDGKRNVLFMNLNGVMTDMTATLAPDFLDLTNDRDVSLADVDGDTWLDIITSGTFEQQPRILMNLGESGGTWQGFAYDASRLPHLESPAGVGPYFCGMAVGDLTGNGRPDIYFTDYGGFGPLGGSEANDLDDRLLINNGSGFFTDESEARLTDEMRESVFGTDADIGDMNGDTFNDIIRSDSTGFNGPSSLQAPRQGSQQDGGSLPNPAIIILYNDGTGNFPFAEGVYLAAPYMVAPADFTQDGRLDLFVVDDAQDSYLINTGNDGNGHAQFSQTAVAPSPKTTGFGGNVSFADLDADGILDVLVADVDTDIPGCDRRLALLQGQGTPPNISFADPLGSETRPWTPQGVFDVQAMHINDDGALDLWIGMCTGTRVFMGFSPEIFDDGFESGDTSGWSTTVP